MTGAQRKLQFLDLDVIEAYGRLRAIKEPAVEAIAASLASIGLRTPISVRYFEERPDGFPPGETADAVVLLTGAHRLEAARRLGWERIECFVYHEGDEIDAQLWEISENLHRAELTVLERDEQVALWVKLNSQKVLAQSEAKHLGGRPEGGVRAAARELGLDKEDARRAVKVAGLSEEAKEAARTAGLDDNRSALLEAAKHSAPDEQVKAIKERTSKREAPAAAVKSEPEFNPLAVRTIVSAPRDYGGLSADQRVDELVAHVEALEADIRGYVAELKAFREMKVQFEQGGFDKVVAGKDEVIRGLETRLYSESAGKAEWMRKANAWERNARKLGWRDTRQDQTSCAPTDDYDDAFMAAVSESEG
jgi:ParB-like chromosome segregation protein Spo0J